MAKDRRDRSRSFDRYRTSPYSSSSKRPKLSSPKVSSSSKPDENVKEFEEARCPVCMEHPHNAILLICSSHDKGCRPYMCDTSYRHSNCFDQFRKSFEQQQASPSPPEESSSTRPSTEVVINPETATVVTNADGSIGCDNKVPPQLMCPLCRGHVKTWVVLDSARIFMNSKSRSCASEACEFSGTYSDLRKHARHEHPLVRPSEADPERQRNWRRMERQRDLGDLLSTLQSSFGEDRPGDDDTTTNDNILLPVDDGDWLTVVFLIRVFRSGAVSSSGPRRRRRSSRRSTSSTRPLWGEPLEDDEETTTTGSSSSSRNVLHNNDDSDAASLPSRHTRQRRRAPDSSREL